jgi:3-phosphoglycerate kinase
LDDEPSLQSQINEQIQNYIKDSPVVSHRAQTSLNQKNYSAFDEQLMREEIRQIAERVCWQVIPEVTEKIVREELAKLLKGIENNS